MSPIMEITETWFDQLRTLTDRAALTDLVDRYVITLDTHDEKSHDDSWYGTIFTDDVRLRFPIGGYDGTAGLAQFETDAKARWDRTHHVSSNCVVEIHGDRAAVRAQMQATHVHLGEEPKRPHFRIGGYYDADAVRTSAGWRFRRLALHVVWTSGEPLAGIQTS
jgi:hypothetical protein